MIHKSVNTCRQFYTVRFTKCNGCGSPNHRVRVVPPVSGVGAATAGGGATPTPSFKRPDASRRSLHRQGTIARQFDALYALSLLQFVSLSSPPHITLLAMHTPATQTNNSSCSCPRIKFAVFFFIMVTKTRS